MTNLEGHIVRLRAVEPDDLDTLYKWENDPEVWPVSGTTEPFSRHQMKRFIEGQQDIGVFRAGQLRLMIEPRSGGQPVGAVDLFDVEPLHQRAGAGILIYSPDNRGQGFATDTIEILCNYAGRTLRLHQLWCTVGADNKASLQLFRSAGFTQTGTRRDWLWTPNGYMDEILLQKFLR